TDHRNASADIYGQTTLLTVSQDPCDGHNDSSTQGCLSETDATARVDRECLAEKYTNHGEYVSCVAKTVRTLREGSEISASLALHLVTLAARSDVGKKQ
ncbi:MAG TPA: hypothetical protein VJM77_00155, partial [Nitrospiria bacterium]|nr:hypothetical protein [Nitrospiria bacterium]